MAVPSSLEWLFWDVKPSSLRLDIDSGFIMARVLERGRLEDVRWVVRTYGLDGVHRFFRDVGHPEVSGKTRSLWRAVLDARDEEWANLPPWRSHSSAPWPG